MALSYSLNDLETFVRVAETGTLTGAANALGVPKSTVSRRVGRLEEALGTALLLRTARSVSLTEHGRRLHARSAAALREITDAARELADAPERPTGVLRITGPPDMAAELVPLFVGFRARHPGVQLDVFLATRRVDLVEEGFDIAFRAGPRLEGDGSLVTRRLSSMAMGAYASPAYLAVQGTPRTPADLAEAACVSHRGVGGDQAWDLEGPAGKVSVPIQPGIVVNDFRVLVGAVLDGGGIGLFPSVTAEPFVRAGRLERVLPAWSTARGFLYLVWPATRHLAPRLRAFVDHVAAEVDADRWPRLSHQAAILEV